jgi:hypothetical protein
MSNTDLCTATLQARNTFFSLLLSGYATDAPPERIIRFVGDRGTKRNTWKGEDGWLAIDEWRTTRIGDGSYGTTSIYHNTILLWEMQYGGYYPERVIPFLRRALMQSYSQQRWCGGRGPSEFFENDFCYVNDARQGTDFASFHGREMIEERINGVWTPVGEHHYRGGFLY